MIDNPTKVKKSSAQYQKEYRERQKLKKENNALNYLCNEKNAELIKESNYTTLLSNNFGKFNN